MKEFTIIHILFLGVVFQMNGQPKDLKKNDKPNVIVIMVDDLSVIDISLNGEALVETPNIDKLAEEGVNFTNAYVTSPVCSPSRASFITGRYAQRFGFQFQMHERYPKNQLEFWVYKNFIKSYPWIPKKLDEIPTQEEIASQGLPEGEVLLPDLLKQVGYKTALVGKWHLGWHESNTPCNYSFDYQFGFYGSHSLYIDEKSKGFVDQKVKKDFTDKHIWKGQRYGPHAIYRNCERIEETGYLTDRITEESIDFLERQHQDPFFLWVSYSAPHSPFQCKQEHYDQLENIQDPVKRVYNAMILSLDENIGLLLKSVENLKFNENTMIVFISDNGGAEYTFATDNGNLKGGKITDLEGGVKVPMFIKWPNKIDAHSTYTNPVSSMDVFSTIAAATRVPLPRDRVYDGVDLMPYLNGETEGYPHQYLYWQRGVSRAIRTPQYKILLNDEVHDTVMFDMNIDPLESHNIYKENKTIAKQLTLTLNTWSESLPPALWPAVIYYEYVDGEQVYLFDQ